MSETAGTRLLFITGTDTGVGKTLLTCLLLTHLRRRNVPALAIKPFSSGNRADALLLQDLQQGDLTLDEINPFFFPLPVAPLVAARHVGISLQPHQVFTHIRSIARRLPRAEDHNQKAQVPDPILLIEGAGGLLVPLAPGYFILDLICDLRAEVIVASRNRLGTLNHTLLTVHALENTWPHAGPAGFARRRGTLKRNDFGSNWPSDPKVILMGQKRSDSSAGSNPDYLTELLAPIPVWKLPFFRGNLRSPSRLEKIEKKIEKTLAQILD